MVNVLQPAIELMRPTNRDTTNDWMAIVILGFFMIPVIAILYRLNWLFAAWSFAFGLFFLSAVLGLI